MIYVDNMSPCATSQKWPYQESCHLFADDTEELKVFARSIGLYDSWIQKATGFIHYDLTGSKRGLAIRCGAVPVNHRFVARFIKERK